MTDIFKENRKLITAVLVLTIMMMLPACSKETETQDPIEIKVLILPKFEIGEMSGDYPGEAQYYYENWCRGGDVYEISGNTENSRLYVKNGVALCVTGAGKVNAALSTANVLCDSRFDFTNAVIISTGCAGAGMQQGVIGDVCISSATVDADLGYSVDSRELTDKNQATTWYHDEDHDGSAYRILNQELVSQVYELVKNVKVHTTDSTLNSMKITFDGAAWAVRNPGVYRCTSVTSDRYWKGETDHENALLVMETYACPDNYIISEMEDNAIALTLDRYGLLSHLVVIRDAVNMDVFMDGSTPDSFLASDTENSLPSTEEDIFTVSMKNNFCVGNEVIKAVIAGKISIK